MGAMEAAAHAFANLIIAQPDHRRADRYGVCELVMMR